ncbi:MAG: KpsF/GutQ family sugar-phosphate isomerase [bacterium]
MLDQQKESAFAVQGASKLGIKQAISNVILQESQALTAVASNIPESASVLVNKILKNTGKIVFSGIGKSGLVAQKLAATFSSLGIPSIFLHACDALHGDLGAIQNNDILIALSKSGTGSELENIIVSLKNNKNFTKNYTVLICCNNGSLSSLADLVVKLPLEREACPLNLAPTSSSTLMMAFGDAIAVVVSSMHNFDKNCFARVHPAGALGKRLILTVNYFMYSGIDLPLIPMNSNFSEILYIISSKKLGICIVADDKNNLCGIVTDGDLRRACDKFGPDVFNKKATDIMTLNPKTVNVEKLAYEALEIMENFKITSLVVVDGKVAVGIIHIHDLIKAGIKG